MFSIPAVGWMPSRIDNKDEILRPHDSHNAAVNGNANLLVEAAQATSDSNSLEELTRPFLGLIRSLTGLDSTYLTEIKPDQNEQRIMFSLNEGHLDIPEGLTVEWHDTLCKRALDTGTYYTADVPGTFPGSQAAKDLGLKTYISVPVQGEENHVLGTLCGASGKAVDVPDDVMAVMEMFSRLIADQWKRDRQRAEFLERAESAERQLRQRALFLAEAEHKLKTPLTILKGWSTMLKDGWTRFSDEDRENALSTMSRAADQASLQVTELLNESRFHILASELDLCIVDMSDLVANVAKEMQGVSDAHQVVTHIESDVTAVADQRALWQVLWHLGENAIKYSPDGGTIELTLRCRGNETVLIVADEGLGIPDDIDVFEPFSRSTEDKFGSIEGTGLGLHVVRNLTQAMKGSVAASKRQGHRGSEFTVSLPRR